jgi:hypothetical protein
MPRLFASLSLRLAFAFALTPVALVSSSTSAASQPVRQAPVTVDTAGVWTLWRLGYHRSSFSLAPSHVSRAFVFNLPRSATQGPPSRFWYLLRLRLKMYISPGSPPGTVNVVAYTNDSAAVLVEFVVSRTSRSSVVKWRTIDLLRGWRERQMRGLSTTQEFINFLPYRGIRPGANTLTFRVRSFGAHFRRLDILRGSGLEVSRHGPAVLRARLSAPRQIERHKESVRVLWSLDNTSGRCAHNVSLRLQFDRGHFSALSRTHRGHADVCRRAAGVFILRPESRGTSTVSLFVSAPAGQDEASATIHVR